MPEHTNTRRTKTTRFRVNNHKKYDYYSQLICFIENSKKKKKIDGNNINDNNNNNYSIVIPSRVYIKFINMIIKRWLILLCVKIKNKINILIIIKTKVYVWLCVFVCDVMDSWNATSKNGLWMFVLGVFVEYCFPSHGAPRPVSSTVRLRSDGDYSIRFFHVRVLRSTVDRLASHVCSGRKDSTAI